MKKRLCILSFCLLFLLLAAVCSAYADDLPSNYSKALKYVKNNQPMEAVATNVGWNPQQLTDIRNAMPEGAAFHFHVSWGGAPFSDETTDLDLRECKGAVTVQELEELIDDCAVFGLFESEEQAQAAITGVPEDYYKAVCHSV